MVGIIPQTKQARVLFTRIISRLQVLHQHVQVINAPVGPGDAPAGSWVSPPARRGGCWDDATRGGGRGSSGRLLLPEEGLISDSDAARRCLRWRISGLPWNANEPPSAIYQQPNREKRGNIRYGGFMSSLPRRCLYAGYANIVSRRISRGASTFSWHFSFWQLKGKRDTRESSGINNQNCFNLPDSRLSLCL